MFEDTILGHPLFFSFFCENNNKNAAFLRLFFVQYYDILFLTTKIATIYRNNIFH